MSGWVMLKDVVNFNNQQDGDSYRTYQLSKVARADGGFNVNIYLNGSNYFKNVTVEEKNQYNLKLTAMQGNVLKGEWLLDETFVNKSVDIPTSAGYSNLTFWIEGQLKNSSPTIDVTIPANNVTLYENDELQIIGTASETDTGDSVTIRYQINANTVRAIKAFVSTGVAEAFSKTLTFRGGSLYDGETLIASDLVDGVAHTLKVYATDDKGGQSPIVERTFYVVPNRAPSLTVNPPVIDGLIDIDTFTIDGSFADADGNQATVSYRINGGNSVQVAQGVSGDFDFNVKFGQLIVGTNVIVVEVTDSYGAKTSKTVRLTKSENVTEINRSVARYKVDPPKGEAQEMLVWIQHDAELTLDVSASMTIDGEAETFVPMTEGTQVTLESGLVESEFYIDAGSAKNIIVLQIDMTKTSADADEAITLITGVF